MKKEKASTSHRITDEVWKMIWKLPVPVKVRNFIWRACGNILATSVNLWKRGIRKSGLCPICKARDETVEHVVLQCEWTLAVWFGLGIGYKVDRQQISSFDRWIEKVIKMDRIEREERMRIMTVIPIAYRIIWKERCNKVFRRKELDVEGCITRINGLV